MMTVTDNESKAIITTVYPVKNGNGANYIAMNLAFATRKRHEHARIAVVDFDFSSPALGLGMHEDRTHGIDNLIDKINGGFLDTELFEENMVVLKNKVNLLRGTQIGRLYDMVKQGHLEKIIEVLHENYDYVFLATNAEPTDGGTPLSLFVADNILLVARYTHANQDVAQRALSTISSMAGNASIGVIYNFYDGQNGLDFSHEFGQWPVFGAIPYLPHTVDNQDLLSRGLQILKKKSDDIQEIYDTTLEAFHL